MRHASRLEVRLETKNRKSGTLGRCLKGTGTRTGEWAERQLVHPYGSSRKGCINCFSCKEIEGKSFGRCAAKDELTPVLDRIRDADVLISGSPLYFHTHCGASVGRWWSTKNQGFGRRLRYQRKPFFRPGRRSMANRGLALPLEHPPLQARCSDVLPPEHAFCGFSEGERS